MSQNKIQWLSKFRYILYIITLIKTVSVLCLQGCYIKCYMLAITSQIEIYAVQEKCAIQQASNSPVFILHFLVIFHDEKLKSCWDTWADNYLIKACTEAPSSSSELTPQGIHVAKGLHCSNFQTGWLATLLFLQKNVGEKVGEQLLVPIFDK